MPYIIFTFLKKGSFKVDAYPFWGNYEPDFYHLVVFAPSRNQARKWAYKLWVRADGRGFNKYPIH